MTSELQENTLLAGAVSRPLVWVVDDDPGVRGALDRLFRATALEVETFASGGEMFDRLARARPRCLVLDLALPGLDGLQIFQALREQGEAIPVVFIAGEGRVQSSVAAMKAGAIDFLEKPVDTDALLRAVMCGLAQEAERQVVRSRADAARRLLATLTRREREVMVQAATGKSNRAIAAELGTSEKTVKVHRGRVMHKLGASSVVDLVHLRDNLPVIAD